MATVEFCSFASLEAEHWKLQALDLLAFSADLLVHTSLL